MKRKDSEKFIRDNRGVSMVEMLICFLLLSILMVASTQMIASAMKTYSNSKKGISGREVADVIADHIEGIIEKAYIDDSTKIVILDGNKKLRMYDNNKQPLLMSVDSNGYLDIAYGNYMDEHWRFDESLYEGYIISSMRFYSVKPDSDVDSTLTYLNKSLYRPGTYQLVLKLNNPKTGTYEAIRYIYCMDEG